MNAASIYSMRRFLRKYSVRWCLAAFLMPVNFGCLTQHLWRDANETKLTIHKLAAVTTASSGQKILLISYRRDDGSLAYLSLPLRSDLRPVDPFNLGQRPQRRDSEQTVVVSTAQVNRIIQSAAPLRRRELTTAEAASIRDIEPETYDSYGCACGPLIAIAYRPLPGGQVERLNFTGSAANGSRTAPDDSVIVLVREKAPRPADEVAGARAKAVLLTPFSVVVDTATILVTEPIFLVLFLANGRLI